MKLLLRRGADVDVLDKANRTAAELASENGQADIAKLIAEYRADANIRNKIRSATIDAAQYDAGEDMEDGAEASLHAAVEEGIIDIVKSLLKRGEDIDCRNTSDETPLRIAARMGGLDIVRLLIERGAEVDSRDKWGWTPLHEACRFEHIEVLRLLLDHGANVNARQADSWTPAHISASHGNPEMVKLFLERGADVHAVNREGQTPYQVSLASGYGEIANLFREHMMQVDQGSAESFYVSIARSDLLFNLS